MNQFKCESCGTVLSNKNNLERHKLTVHQRIKNAKCDLCGKDFFTSHHVKLHKLRVHEGVKEKYKRRNDVTIRCNICDNSFGSSYYLNRHIKTIHQERQPIQCLFCEKSFRSKSAKLYHLQDVHENKIYRCDKCPKTFRVAKILRSHLKEVHEKKRNFVCRVCKFPFFSRGNLQRHFMYVHMKSNKKFKCDSCGQTYGQQQYLISHKRRVHQKSKSHKCDLCKNRFLKIIY